MNRTWIVSIPVILFFACSRVTTSQPYSTSPSGVRYKVHVDSPGREAKVGDLVQLHIVTYNDRDSVLYTTYKYPPGPPMQVRPAEFTGDLMSALQMFSAGDSFSIWIRTDSVKNFEPKPGLLELGQDMRLTVKILKVFGGQEEYEKYEAGQKLKRVAPDTLRIRRYLDSAGLKAIRTPGGVYIVTDKQGYGPPAAKDNYVIMNSTGRLLNGTQFDKSPEDKPYKFRVGHHEALEGLDEAMLYLTRESRSRIFIPSMLAYGPGGAGTMVPPNAVVVFEVEIIDIR
jgi:FKBP-type peptidyl-prolyl cis-trans isomerase FkpA